MGVPMGSWMSWGYLYFRNVHTTKATGGTKPKIRLWLLQKQQGKPFLNLTLLYIKIHASLLSLLCGEKHTLTYHTHLEHGHPNIHWKTHMVTLIINYIDMCNISTYPYIWRCSFVYVNKWTKKHIWNHPISKNNMNPASSKQTAYQQES